MNGKEFFTLTFVYATYQIEIDREYRSYAAAKAFYTRMKKKDHSVVGYIIHQATRIG